MNYTQLKADIADYLHRTDLTDSIPGFIARAESAIFRELNVKDIQTVEEGTAYEGYIDLPSDFGSLVRLTTTEGSVERTLDFVSPVDRYANQTNCYTFEGEGLRLFGSGTAYKLYYTAIIQPLSASRSTNWLLTNAADLYLYASALEGARYIKDMEQVQLLSGVVAGLVDSVRRLSDRKFIPSGSLQIKAR